jgi:hypothetical protein
MVTLEFPLLVKVTFCALLLPVFTFPRLTLVGFAPISRVAVMPVPLRLIPSGEFGALLTKEIEPVELVAVAGVNSTLNVPVFPAAMANGVVKPLRLNPVPVTLACEMVTLALPGFDNVNV